MAADTMQDARTTSSAIRRWAAAIVFLIVDLGFVAWGGMAALFLDRLIGPGGRNIMVAGYEGYTRGAWADLVKAAPHAAGYMNVLYRTYGAYNVVIGLMGSAIAITAFRRGERWAWWTLLVGNTLALVSAMIYDRVVDAIGPFELTEYLGLALIWAACAATAPVRGPGRTPIAATPSPSRAG